jgi:GH24 family phage-related lysozyme (muramidase)
VCSSDLTKKWTGTASFTTPGTYSATAVSTAGGGYSSTGFKTSVFIATQSDYTVTTSEERRVSDKMISLISQWEGYRAAVYADTLSSTSVPTIGYGCTLGTNAVFYNNMSQTEAWSMMVNKINSSSYTTELNKMIQNNKFLMSQNQADCLISFAYNVGSGYFNSSDEMDFIKIMKNAVVPPSFSPASTYPASITLDTVIRAQSGNLSAVTGNISAGTAVSVTGGDFSDPKDGWYHVQMEDNTTGWINSAYVSFNDKANMVHDLNYTNAYAFGTELIRWNQAGGKFYAGLFYRRLGEANAYNYNDYNALHSNKYGYTYPSAAASLD